MIYEGNLIGTVVENFIDEDIFWSITRAKNIKTTDILPAGFPIPVDENSGEVCEPALLFLYESYVQDNGKDFSLNTLHGYCQDLKEWWRYLEEFEFTWTSIIDQNITAFLDSMVCTISPETEEPYATSTINRRAVTVCQFYKWAKNQSFLAADTPDMGLLRNGTVGRHIRRRRADEKLRVSVMRLDQAEKIFHKLGPLPSEWMEIYAALAAIEPGSSQKEILEKSWSSRLRLGAEIALNVGLRITEVTSLLNSQFAIYPEDLVDHKPYNISITGKKRKLRTIKISGRMLREIRIYIKGEREMMLKESGLECCSSLLINPIGTGSRFAKKTSNRTFQRGFSEACVSAGEIENRKFLSYEESHEGIFVWKEVVRPCPLFVFHDLRHSYSVWTYYSRKESGDSEPWFYIKTQLGHSSIQTTQDIYLRVTWDFEASVTDQYMKSIWFS